MDFQLLSPWPAEALRFASAVERVGRLIVTARPSAQATANGLCLAGMLESCRSPEDRRIRILALTDYGAGRLSELDAAVEMLLLEVANDFSREGLRSATAMLELMAERLRRRETILKRRRLPRSAA